MFNLNILMETYESKLVNINNTYIFQPDSKYFLSP